MKYIDLVENAIQKATETYTVLANGREVKQQMQLDKIQMIIPSRLCIDYMLMVIRDKTIYHSRGRNKVMNSKSI